MHKTESQRRVEATRPSIDVLEDRHYSELLDVAEA